MELTITLRVKDDTFRDEIAFAIGQAANCIVKSVIDRGAPALGEVRDFTAGIMSRAACAENLSFFRSA